MVILKGGIIISLWLQVLADGTVLDSLSTMRKDNTGLVWSQFSFEIEMLKVFIELTVILKTSNDFSIYRYIL